MNTYFVKSDPSGIIPKYHSDKAACCDLTIPQTEIIRSKTFTLVNLKIIAIPPEDYHWQIYFRSSTPKKYPGLILANGVGIIDGDYIGPEDEIKLALYNTTENDIVIYAGERVAQMRLVRDIKPVIKELKYEQIQSRQSRGGFGST